MAVALFVVSGVVLALSAHSYGWAALLFAAAAYSAFSTGMVGRPHRPRSASVPAADEVLR